MTAVPKTNQQPDFDQSEFIFRINRTFNAPQSLIWKLWTDKAHLARWFGPKGSKVVKSTLDLREGGIYHYAMEFAGVTMWGKWTFLDINEPNYLKIISGFSNEEGGPGRHPLAPEWPEEILALMSFIDKGDNKTEVLIEWQAINATEAERKVFKDGMQSMQQGWGGTFDQLAEYLASL